MTDPNWMEISYTVDGEMAESVAEVLARYIPDGVVIESTAVDTSDPNTAGHAVGPLRVSAYIRMDEKLEATRQRLEEAFWYLGRIRPLPAPEFRPIQDENWVDAWKGHYHPIEIGRNLIIVPAWLEPEVGDRKEIRIDPGMAFGTGTHPSTRMCLEMIEDILDMLGDPGATEVIDVGCGSGILAIGALKLGAGRALGVDIDPDAAQAARQNARLNAVEENLELGVGSLAEVLNGNYGIRNAGLVLANILAPVIERLLDEGLGELLTPDGHLVLSGILEEQSPDIESALAGQDLQVIERRTIEDWVALHARFAQ